MSNHLRLLREPLLHFLIVGSLLFAVYRVVSGPAPAPVNEILVTPERITQLAAGFEAVRKRLPTDDELGVLVDSFVREEVYYREAMALGLERDDAVIRRRLQQKMEFLTDTGGEFLEPEEGDLEAYYQANSIRFRDPPAIAFTQVFLGQQASPDRVTEVLAGLRSDDRDPSSWGKPILLPSSLRLSTSAEIDGTFGVGFFSGLMQLPSNEWDGPIQSGFGLHLVRVTERLPTRVPPLSEVRDLVEREWRSDNVDELHDLVYERLLLRYKVVVPESLSVTQ